MVTFEEAAKMLDEAAESLRILRERICQIGYDLTVDRGDSPMTGGQKREYPR